MKSLDKRAVVIFRKLIEGLVTVGDHRTVDNCESAFMPVHVEVIGVERLGKVVSIAHYFLQAGDSMADPECTFLVQDDAVFPMTFQQDPGFYDRAAWFDGGRLLFKARKQADLVSFCNGWMRNIADQQDL